MSGSSQTPDPQRQPREPHHPIEAAEHAVGGSARSTTAEIDEMVREADAGEYGLERRIGPVGLTSIGVAAVVGAGIFVVTGEAASKHAGPAVVISFVIAGVVATLSALCYAELSSMIPLAGSTYSYAYASMGSFIAWVIGWDLLVEYLFGAANVANGWSGYLNNVLTQIGLAIPAEFSAAPIANHPGDPTGIANVPAMCLVALLTIVLCLGVRESAGATTLFVIVKLTTLVLFVGIGAFSLTAENYQPFVPANTGAFDAFGWTGVIAAAGTVFYSYISFDAVCTAAQEARNPRRTVPIGIFGSLGIATLLYVAVGIVLVGLVPYTMLDTSNPLATALDGAGLNWLAVVVDIGAVIGLGASVLALLYGQTRIMMRMSEDGMLPDVFGRVSPKSKTPVGAQVICGVFAIIMAGLLPLSILTELISIGTLLAFVIVSAAVIVLRRRRPDLPRPFKVPWGYTVPILAIVTALAVMASLPLDTWLRLVVWLAIGLIIYFTYSRKRANRVMAERAAKAHLSI